MWTLTDVFDLGDSGDGNPCIVSLSSPVTTHLSSFQTCVEWEKIKVELLRQCHLSAKIRTVFYTSTGMRFLSLFSFYLVGSYLPITGECPLVILVDQTILKNCLQDSNIILSTCGPHVEFQAHMLICYITGTQVISVRVCEILFLH